MATSRPSFDTSRQRTSSSTWPAPSPPSSSTRRRTRDGTRRAPGLTTSMRAVVYEDVRRVDVADVPDPTIADPGDAVIRVTAAAICGSDLHFYHGKAPLMPGDGIGHEGVGIVEEVGPDVERFRQGDRVVMSFDIACGECWFCRHDQTSLCEDFKNLGAGPFGGGLGGAQAEQIRVPHADVNLLPIPDGMDDE